MCYTMLIFNEGEPSGNFLPIVFKDDKFHSKCISNLNVLFSETVSSNKHGRICFDKKGYQDSHFVSFNATTSSIYTYDHIGDQISSPLSKV